MFNKKKYRLTTEAPVKWAQVVPGKGLHEFVAEYLTDDDCEALIAAGSAYVERVSDATDKAKK